MRHTTVQVNNGMMADFQQYLIEREASLATRKKYIRDVKCFFHYLGERKIFTKETLLEYKMWLIERYAANSVNSMLVALNQFLVSQELGHMKLKRLKIQRQCFCEKEKELTKKDYQKLIQTARSEGKEQIALIMETIAATGIRISELEAFRAEDVKKGSVEVINKGKYRVVILTKALQKKLQLYIRKNNIKTGPIFFTKNGRSKDRSNIWREMKALAERANVDAQKIFPHNLRHLFARTFYRLTKNLAMLADILGHSSLDVTRIYTMKNIGEWRREIEKLNLLLE